MAKMTPAKFEKTAKDKKEDKAGAKKMGIPVKKYEGSPADLKQDMKTIRAMNKGKMK